MNLHYLILQINVFCSSRESLQQNFEDISQPDSKSSTGTRFIMMKTCTPILLMEMLHLVTSLAYMSPRVDDFEQLSPMTKLFSGITKSEQVILLERKELQTEKGFLYWKSYIKII